MRIVDEGHGSKSTAFIFGAMSAGNSKKESSSVSETSPLPAALPIEETVYRGEGNANIVIALPQEHKVIRFRKSSPDEVSPDGGRARVQREAAFAGNVVSCFLGSYMQIPEIVRCDVTDIAKLSDAIRPLRPEKRRHKEITDTYATKFPDYTFLKSHLRHDETVFQNRSTFCVEIKPKQGFLRQAEQNLPICPYCLTQYAKLRRNSISARSNYCPFDLFSGVDTRMKAAVRELLKSPQNNLKIFKDGVVVYGQESSSPSDLEDVLNEWFRNVPTCRNERARVDEFCNLVYAALTRPFAQEQLELPAYRPVRNFLLPVNQPSTFCTEAATIARAERCLRLAGKNCNFDGNELPKDSVLERVRNMQRLSYVSTNYIYNIYSEFASLLNDDMIYSDLMKLNKRYTIAVSNVLSDKRSNAAIQTHSIKEIYFRTLLRSTIAEKYDDLNGNHNATSEYILSTNNDRMLVNSNLSQTEISSNLDSHQAFYGNKSLHNCRKINDKEDERESNMLIMTEHLLALRNYLLFVMAKDCSILISFCELNPENISKMPAENTIKLSEQLYFLSSIGVSDLDPKSIHSIEKHRQRDIDNLDSVISLLEEDSLLKNR